MVICYIDDCIFFAPSEEELISNVRDLASFIGLAVAAEPAVDLAPVRYKYLEIIRNRELARHQGDYAARVSLDEHAKELVLWWDNNVPLQSKSLRSSSPDLELFADACLTGWGAIVGSVASGGSWAHAELDHINCLELRAILLGLQSLCKNVSNAHIRLRSDNTVAVACLNRSGSTKIRLNFLIEEIYAWAGSRGLTLSAAHVKGTQNVEADSLSRLKNLDTEWMLDPLVFRRLCDMFYVPDIDLFASRLNAQVATYVSWKPDPAATFVDAFSINWADRTSYAFPPFSLIARVLRKLQEDRASLIAILPLWPSQAWFPGPFSFLFSHQSSSLASLCHYRRTLLTSTRGPGLWC
ncbi:uncharacterized protein LOC123499956 [Portunus trituberculatus]|uniref:uncharacterized protein LOC123499956 n=1 Tax=Portunus trituberculatus TaxID=210409 RepID=UPI001E1CCF03|nr:uncharacterized protein LOC123499956 [Portunus trituberculatus]